PRHSSRLRRRRGIEGRARAQPARRSVPDRARPPRRQRHGGGRRQCAGEGPHMKPGRLIAVGVGPGDPELMTLKAVRALGRAVAVLAEGDPLFYGSYMHLHARLAPRFVCEVIAGVTGMSGCWSAAETPIAQGEDVFSVLPALLAEDELARRLAEADAAVIM